MRLTPLLFIISLLFCAQKTIAQYLVFGIAHNSVFAIKQQPDLVVRVNSEVKGKYGKPMKYLHFFKVTDSGVVQSEDDSLGYFKPLLFPRYIKAKSNGHAYLFTSFEQPFFDSGGMLSSVANGNFNVNIRYLDSFHVLTSLNDSNCHISRLDKEGRLMEMYDVACPSANSQVLPKRTTGKGSGTTTYTYHNGNLVLFEMWFNIKGKRPELWEKQTFTYDKYNRIIYSVYENYWSFIENRITMRYQYYE